jgi:choline kinase|tara:strand:+ start:1451 stop:2269 length:819 start_codon:yes stop_codon:yes gene_type:complete
MKKEIFRNDLNAIILAAGQGTRLAPLTKNKPKCMVNLFGKTLLEWQISTFKKCGITDISVVTGYRADLIDLPGLEFFQNKKFETTNMVESLFCASEKLNKSTIVSYGDIIFEKRVLDKLLESKHDFSVVIDKNWRKQWDTRFKNPLDYAESLRLNTTNDILDIGKKVQDIDEISGQYIGLMKFQNNGINIIKDFYHKCKEHSIKNSNPLNPSLPFEKSYMTDFLQGLINSNYNLKAVKIENGWLELDSVRDYEIYQEMYSNNSLKELIVLEN